MRWRHCWGVRRAVVAGTVACLALLSIPAVSIAADPSASPAGAADRASSLMARGAGYGQPQGASRVRALQRDLRTMGLRPGPVDGLYGPLTEAAVERLQRDSGLSVDGIVGSQTRRVLTAEVPPLVPGAGYGQPGGSPQVRAVQRSLRALGQRPGPVDGLYGPGTRAAVERFQRTTGQPASGVLSPATAAALARADDDQSPRPASDTRRGGEARQPGSRPASREKSSGRDDRARHADGSRTAGGFDRSKIQAPEATDDRSQGTDGEKLISAALWAVLAAVALAAFAGLYALWRGGPRRRPQATGVPKAGGRPSPNASGEAAKPPAASTAAPASEPRPQANGVTALGYVSVYGPESVDGPELREQMAAIDAACRERGLVLKQLIRDLEEVKDSGSERPGMRYAFQRIAAGEASCLVVAELGRLSRSATEVGFIIEWLRHRKTRLVAVGDGLDTGTKGGGDAADKLASLCAFAAGPQSPVRNGRHDTEQRPAERGNATPPDREEDRAVKERIHAMRASGMTLQAIANQLNAEEVPTLRGGAKWRPSGVQAAAGYRRPGPKASEPGDGQRVVNGSSGREHAALRRRTSSGSR